MSELAVRRWRAAPAVVAIVLVVLGVIATAARLDGASDGGYVKLGWSSWRSGGVVAEVPVETAGLQDGDLVTAVEGHRLADGLG